MQRVVLERGAGGRIFEEHKNGRRFQWGRVLEWEPPHRITFTWHPARAEQTAQEVEMTFLPEGAGTRPARTASRWDRWGPGAAAHRGYSVGWQHILNLWAGKRTAMMTLLDAIAAAMRAWQRMRGGRNAAIARARGEILRN